MNNFGYLNSSFYFIYIFQQTCEKDLWCTYAYSLTYPPSHTCQYAFSWTTPPPSKHMYFTDDPLINYTVFILTK